MILKNTHFRSAKPWCRMFLILLFLMPGIQAKAQGSDPFPYYCLPPLGVNANTITATSAVLSWTAPSIAPPQGYRIYISTVNAYPGSGVTMASTNATSYLLDGLLPNTTYFYFMRAMFDGAVGSAWQSGNFRTVDPLAGSGCLTADNGLYPQSTFVPECTGDPEIITDLAYTSEYSNVSIVPGKQYTFSSSNPADYITISNAAGTSVLAFGTGSISWLSGNTTGVVRYYTHENSTCGEDFESRTRFVACGAPVDSNSCNATLSNLAATEITAASVYLHWNSTSVPIGGYQVYMSVSNTAPVATTDPTHDFGTQAFEIYKLNYGTTYYYWARANCGGYKGAWVSGGSFTTLPAPNCSDTPRGQLPPFTITPICDNWGLTLSSSGGSGYYSVINIQPNTTYTFTNENRFYYLTIRNAIGTIYYKQGQSPLVWNSGGLSGTIQLLVHNTPTCGTGALHFDTVVMRCLGTTLGADDFSWKEDVQLAPNPASESFTVDTGVIVADKITVSDNLGRIVDEFSPTAQKLTLDAKQYSAGLYYISIVYGNNRTVKKLLVRH